MSDVLMIVDNDPDAVLRYDSSGGISENNVLALQAGSEIVLFCFFFRKKTMP